MARYFKKGGFVYTQEQAEAIKNGDINARNKFYFDNYNILQMMAWKWANMFKGSYGSLFRAEDLLQQVYLDLPYLYYNGGNAVLAFWVRKSFKMSIHGGLSFMYENHCTHYQRAEFNQWGYTAFDYLPEDRDEGSIDTSYLLDAVACSPSSCEEIEQRESVDSLPLLRGVLGRFLSGSQVDLYLLCLDGYTVAEACRKLGVNKRGKSSIELKLRKCSAEVVEALLSLGYECALPFVGVAPSAPVKKFVQTEEERAKHREEVRRYREKRKKCVA